MKVKIETIKSNFKGSHRKSSQHFSKEMICLEIKENKPSGKSICVRWYETTNRTYCCVWLNNCDGHYDGGTGFAGGYGYDTYSASLALALQGMGIIFTGLHSSGESEEALRMLADAFGFQNTLIHTAHA